MCFLVRWNRLDLADMEKMLILIIESMLRAYYVGFRCDDYKAHLRHPLVEKRHGRAKCT